MTAPRRPWARLSPADRIEAVRPLLDQANSIIAWKLGAKSTDIAPIAARLRREAEPAPVAAAPAPSTGPTSWPDMTPAEKIAWIAPLLADGIGYEDIAVRVGTDRAEIKHFAVELRRQIESQTDTGVATPIGSEVIARGGIPVSANASHSGVTAGETATNSPAMATERVGGVAGACSALQCGENRTGTASATSGDSSERRPTQFQAPDTRHLKGSDREPVGRQSGPLPANPSGERRERTNRPAGECPEAPPMDEAREGPSETAAPFYSDPQTQVAADGRPSTLSSDAAGARSDGLTPVVDRGGALPGYSRRQSEQAVVLPPPAAMESPMRGVSKPWHQLHSRDKEAAVLPLRKAGKSAAAIAIELCVPSRNAIITVIGRLQLKGLLPPAGSVQAPRAVMPKRKVGTRPLSDEWGRRSPEEKRVAVLELRAAGRTSEQIAAELQISDRTVNQIVGQAKQAGVAVPPGQHRKPAPRPVSARIRVVEPRLHPGNIARKAASRQFDHAPVIDRLSAFDPIPGVEPVPYGSPGCKWSVDGLAGPGLLWCGAPREPECSYCPSHRRLGTAAPTARTERIVKEAEKEAG